MIRVTSARRLLHRLLREGRGNVVTEFALIIPVALLLTMGGIEFLLLMYDYQIATDATREGVRTALTRPSIADLSNLETDQTVTCTSTSCSPGSVVNTSSFTDVYNAVKAVMDASMIDITEDNVEVDYSWSQLDDTTFDIVTPIITVRLVDVTHEMFVLPQWIGIPTDFPMPEFSATRVAHKQTP